MTYYKAYLEITRLITEYEVLVNSTTCVDAVTDECNEQDAQWSLKLDKRTQRLSELTQRASSVKGHITVQSKAEKHLTAHIQSLTVACADLDETVSSLNKVRDAIRIVDVCAGLGRSVSTSPMSGVIQAAPSLYASGAQVAVVGLENL